MTTTEPTPSLAEYRRLDAEDDNTFWRLSSGDRQNLLEEAIEENDRLRAQLDDARAAAEGYREGADAMRTERDDLRAALERRLLQVKSIRRDGPKRINPLLCTTPVTTVEDEIEDARLWWQAEIRREIDEARSLADDLPCICDCGDPIDCGHCGDCDDCTHDHSEEPS